MRWEDPTARGRGWRVAQQACYRAGMAITFRDQGSEDVFNGVDSKAARKVCPPDLLDRAREKLFLIDDAETLEDLRSPPGNRLEALKGDRVGQYSIRVNRQYRVCFRWTERGARDVEITDYHS
jgi:toxin HigB-1